MPVTEINIHMIQSSSRILSSLRTCAAGAVIFAYVRCPRVRSPPNRLIFHRCVAEIIFALALFTGSWGPDLQNDSTLCKIQSILMEWGSTVTLLWSVIMCWSLLLVAYRVRNFATEQKIGVFWKATVYGAPLLIASVIAFVSLPHKSKLYSNSVLWCWNSPQSDLLRYVTSGMNLLLIVISWLTLFLVARRVWPNWTFRTSTGILREKAVGRYIITLSAVLAVYGIGRVPFTINFVIGQFDAMFSLIQEVFSLVQDFMVCFIFYLTWFVRPLREEEHVWETEQFDFHDDGGFTLRTDSYHKLSRERGGGRRKSIFLRLTRFGEKKKEHPVFCRRRVVLGSGRLKYRSVIRKIIRMQRNSLGPGPFAGKYCWGGGGEDDDERLVSTKFSKGGGGGRKEEIVIAQPVRSVRSEDLGFSKKSVVPVEFQKDLSSSPTIRDPDPMEGTVQELQQSTFHRSEKESNIRIPISPGLCFPPLYESQVHLTQNPVRAVPTSFTYH